MGLSGGRVSEVLVRLQLMKVPDGSSSCSTATANQHRSVHLFGQAVPSALIYNPCDGAHEDGLPSLVKLVTDSIIRLE